MERMKNAINPLFTDMTWGAGGSTAELSLQLATHAHDHGHVSNMHLTCTNMEKDGDPKKAVHEALQACVENGIRNIVALRGDPPAGEEEWKAAEGGFTCALDLVEYIREHFGDTFGISVAGYPEGHPNAISEIEDPAAMSEAEKARSSSFDGKVFTCKDDDYKKEMDYLKKKVDAGAGESDISHFLPFKFSVLSLKRIRFQTLSLHKCFLTQKFLARLLMIAESGVSTALLFPE